MKVSEIDILSVDHPMPSAKKRMRQQAPKYIASVINDTKALPHIRSIDELRPEHIQPLAGGVDAATYLINHPKEQVIIKIGVGGVSAEAEAIEAWRKRHVRAPRMIATGVVPITKGTRQPYYYLVQQALLDTSGRIIETCADYLVYAPHQARKVGRALGRQLNKIHSSVSNRFFGEFKDSPGSKANYKTWNGYVYDALAKERSFLKETVGISDEMIDGALRTIKNHSFIKKGRYLHGDFSIRNVAVKSRDPLKVSVFDPNPIIGDPTWDVSFLINNYEYEKRRLVYDDSQRDLYVRYQQLWIGFKQDYKRVINEQSLRVAQVIQAIYQAQYTLSINDTIGLKVRKEVITQLIKELQPAED